MADLDAFIAAVIQFYETPPPPDLPRVRGIEIRERWAATSEVLNLGAPDRPVERGRVIAGRDGGEPLTADLYPPDGAEPHPAILFAHGGSWVAGSPRTHDKLARRLAEHGFLVASVDYALAPEHPHPAGLDDCVAAADWLAAEAGALGADPARLAIMGDSAGGNLAAAALDRLLARDGATPFRAAVLPYGVYDFPAMLRLPEESPFVNGRTFAWQLDDYLGPDADEALLTDPSVSPRLSPRLGQFPPTFLTAGTHDPLLAQSREFARALTEAGAAVDLLVCEGATHAFLQIEDVPAAGEALDAIVAFLRKALDG